ncbi:hypothetical protein GCM10007049_21980 [Echinicola pacifica]|uniref:Concanavalin A-like lectin/glucanases superfamily protein n=1 Tax=Echinicola pacifica TaxID=346377 RepID=A0A918Q0M4_9BACT|nr:heparin lyase I family protein [Echinicola pacifica]GGZ28607.1 hypothetical protein GCM10007049_21980 [Echinicola pacifica]
MAIQIVPGDLGSKEFFVNDESYPVGEFFLYRSGDSVMFKSLNTGCTAISGKYYEFIDEAGDSFNSSGDLLTYLDQVIFEGNPNPVNGQEIVSALQNLPKEQRLSYMYLKNTPSLKLRETDFNVTGDEVQLNEYEYTEGNILLFDRKRMYGSHMTPLRGDILDYYDAGVDSTKGEGMIFHKDSVVPNFPDGFYLEAGSYLIDNLNIIRYQFISNSFKLYSITSISGFEPADLNYGLVLSYDFNQEALRRGAIVDKSLYENEGVLVNSNDALWEPDSTDGYKIVLGNSDDENSRSYIQVPVSDSLESVKYKFSIYVDFGRYSSAGRVFFATFKKSSGDTGIKIGTVSDGRLEVSINESIIGTYGRIRSNSPEGSYPLDGTTLGYLITYDGLALKIYVNGVLNKSQDIPEAYLDISSDSDWFLGKMDGETPPDRTVITNFMVWNRVLTDKEIEILESKIDKVSVVKYCPFDEILTNTVRDQLGEKDAWIKRQCFNDPEDISISDFVSREGGTSGKFVLTRGLLYGGTKHRTELLSETAMPEHYTDMKKWTSFSIYFPEDYYIDESHQIAEVIYQVHAGHGQSPPVSIRSEYDHFYLQVCFGEFDATYEEHAELKDELRQRFYFGEIDPGSWHDFVVYYELSPFSDGVTKLWFNRDLVVDYVGPNLYTNDVEFEYSWKVGLYAAAWLDGKGETLPNDRVLYYDEVRIADNNLPASVMFQKMDPEGRKALSGISYPNNPIEIFGQGK